MASIGIQDVFVIEAIGTVTRLLGAPLLVAALVYLIKQRALPKPTVPLVWMFVFFAYCTLSVFWSIDPSTTASRLQTSVQLMVMVGCLWIVTTSQARLNDIAFAYLAGVGYAVASLVALIVSLGDASAAFSRLSLGSFNPNYLANTMACGLPLAWYLVVKHRSPLVRAASLLLIPSIVVGVLSTGSRGGLLAALVGCSFVLVTLTSAHRRYRWAVLAMVISAGVVAMDVLPAQTLERLASTAPALTEGDLNSREDIWRIGFLAWGERPWFGSGFGTFPAAITPYAGAARSPHNTFMNALVAMGIVGLALALLAFYSVLFYTSQLPKFERMLIGALLLMMFMGHSANDNMYSKFTWFTHTWILSAQTIWSREARRTLFEKHHVVSPSNASS